ncbi:MAG: AzlC family ABC transporter permease [Clostridia bacterium]|nr:AzlC family ABC transporter permease [Clostridia bacterium]
MNEYWKGFRDGLPIGLGYFSVSMAFGMAAVQSGMPIWAAVAISMSNMTSAGQFAGLTVILAAGSYLENALTQLIINLRYALMSISLSQKLKEGVRPFERLIMAFGNTDEIFALASGQKGAITPAYFYGLMTLPWLCWSGGTLAGASASALLPAAILSAFGIAIYGMFVAIVIPAMKKSLAVIGVVAVAVALSCAFEWLPLINRLSDGFCIIICACLAAVFGAVVRPVED